MTYFSRGCSKEGGFGLYSRRTLQALKTNCLSLLLCVINNEHALQKGIAQYSNALPA